MCYVVLCYVLCSVVLCYMLCSVVCVMLCVMFRLAGFITLRSIVITELLGVRHLMNALGLLFMFQGFASVVGSPLSGKITMKAS